MDATLAATAVTQLTEFKTDLLAQFGAILVPAFALIISVAAVRFTINHFRSLVHA